MALRFKAEESKAILPAGMFKSVLDTIELRDGPHGAFLLWSFHVAADGVESVVSVPTSTKLTGGSKPRAYTNALLGRPLDDGEEIDLSELCGAACMLVVTVKQLDGGGMVNRVANVLPLPPENGNDDVRF